MATQPKTTHRHLRSIHPIINRNHNSSRDHREARQCGAPSSLPLRMSLRQTRLSIRIANVEYVLILYMWVQV